jgi:hypothetical protein
VGAAICALFAGAYALAALWIVADLHMGHVVQDGIDTGDMLALAPLVMAFVSIGLATCCWSRFEALADRRR